MIHGEAALAYHLLKIPAVGLVSAIPTDAHQDDCRLEVTPLERGLVLLQEDDSRRVMV